MKTSRSLLIWTTLALCGVMVLGAMSWLTRGVLAAEKERVEAEARADLEERTRLALWRMDAAGAAIMLGENRHSPADYSGSPSPFLTINDPLVNLHFELRESGTLSSPEIDLTQTTGASGSKRVKLSELRKLLGEHPLPGNEWSRLKCAAEAGETAWNVTPKDAALEKSSNAILRQNKTLPSPRVSSDYQANFSGAERAQRAKTVEETVARSFDADQAGSQAAAIPAREFAGPAETPPKEQITDLGIMRAIWIGEELFLLRQFTISLSGSVGKGVQGVWLDREVLKQRLLAEVADLLPSASLTASAGAAQDPLSLVSFPFRLQRNETAPLVGSKLNGPLMIGWGAVLLAILTTSLLVHGVMRLSERRASFVSAVTHELRTPLTTFRLYSDMLESGAVKPEKRGDYLRVLSREADRLSHLVENVLAFSRIERGNARSQVREAAAGEMLEQSRERLEARLATAGLTLEMDSSCALRVRVDTAAVEHILFNLIDNAAKYAARSEPPVVKVAARGAGRTVEITVSDHGPGIAASERGRIFQAFHKSAREAAESMPGVGLGLALSRRLARAQGGELECAGGGGGACFILRLPM
jgi:signal transduction histidine kinase